MNEALRVGVVLVHFHTPELTRDAVEAFHVSAELAHLAVELVVVDNGSTATARQTLDRLPVRRLDPGRNSGYAGGVNLGVRALEDVDIHVLANPDVLVEPECLGALVDAIRHGADVVGPRFFWDRPGGWLLPPTEAVGRREELRRVFAATRGGAWARRARSAWRRHARRQWDAKQDLPSVDLSGALLAVDARVWSRVGPFDEGYALYFEETDWLQRARSAGLDVRHVPAAEAVHLYAQSTPSEPRAQAWFASSQARFRQRFYGRVFSRVLDVMGRSTSQAARSDDALAIDPEPSDGHWCVDAQWRWIEISPSPLGFPGAGLRLGDDAAGDRPMVPETIRRRLAPGRYWLRALDADDRERELRCIEHLI